MSLFVRMIVAVGLASSLLAAASAPVAAAADGSGEVEAECQISRFSVPDDEIWSEVEAGDPSGRWVAGLVGTSAGTTVVRWRDGERSEVDVPPGLIDIGGINRHGDVTGAVLDDAGVNHPFAVVDGSYIELADEYSWGTVGISATRKVAGASLDTKWRTLLWDVSHPDNPAELEGPAGYEAIPVGINARDVVAIHADNYEEQQYRSFIFGPKGRKELLPTEAGLSTSVRDVSVGWAVGYQGGGMDRQLVRWNLSRHRAPRIIDTTMTLPNSVNAHGIVAGQIGSGDAALVIGKRTRELPHLHEGGTSYVEVVADNVQAAGTSEDADGNSHAVRWTC